MKNLIDPFGAIPDNSSVGKAEHLRYLLLDWMHRVQDKDTNDINSAPIYNANEGMGDIYEILHRQSWRASGMWVGDPFLIFRKVAWVGSRYIRNEWLYIGRRRPGSLICSFQILGRDAALFHLSADSATLTALDVYRLKVTLAYNTIVQVPESVDAFIQINNNVGDRTQIPLSITSTSKPPLKNPTRMPSTKPLTSKPSRKRPTRKPTSL